MKEILKDFEDRNILNTLSNSIFVKQHLEKIIEYTNYLPETSKIKERLYIIYQKMI